MGLCLSCLRGSDSRDDEVNETSSLLRNQHDMYSLDYMQEAELLKQQQRQQELNAIVNNLSDNLIDVSSFLNTDTHATIATQVRAQDESSRHSLEQPTNTDSVVDDDEKQYPRQYGAGEKDDVLKQVAQLSGTVKDSCNVTFSEQLYLKF